jgi:hypothetical protein
MSTPTGKPSDPTGGGSRTANEGAGGTGDSARSPYAPKRSRLRAVPSADSGDDGATDLPRFLVGGDRPRAEPVVPQQPAANLNDSLLRFDDNAQRVPADRQAADRHPVDLDRTEKPSAPRTVGAQAPTEHRGERGEDPERKEGDIERLEASLRWLKNQSAELHPPQADQPIRAPERRPMESARGAVKAPTPRSLEPQNLVGPALMRAQRGKSRGTLATLRGPLMILVAGLVAAPVAYYFAGSSTTAPEGPRTPRLAAVDSQAVVPPPQLEPTPIDPPSEPARAVRAAPALPGQSETNATRSAPKAAAPAVPPQSETLAARTAPRAAAPAVPPQGETVTVLPPSRSEPPAAVAAAPVAPAPAPVPAGPPVRVIDPAEVKLLMQQGQQFIAAGDVVAARVVFQRAAEGRDAGAALAMGATYDPLFLARIGVLGVAADVAKARVWYERAKEYGSQEAPRRIEMLANR